MIQDPDIIRQIAVKDFHYFTNRRGFDGFFEGIASKFLTVLRDEDWKRVRTILTPTFTSGKMRRMFAFMNETATEAIDALHQELIRNKRDLDVKDFTGKYTLDVIARCCFGMDPKSHQDPNNRFLVAARDGFKPNMWALFVLFLMPKWLGRILTKKTPLFPEWPMEFFKQAILHMIKERREKNIVVNDFLQLLLEAQSELDDKETKENDVDDREAHHVNENNDDATQIKEMFDRSKLKNRTLNEDEILANSVLFLVAGHETTSSLIALVLYNLARHQRLQNHLYTELKDLELTYAAISGHEYLDAVVQETLRLYPVAPFTDRETRDDYMIPGTSIFLPKGCIVNLLFLSIHYNPEYYENPERFDPDRFLPENRHKLKPYTYLPFGSYLIVINQLRFILLV